MAFIDCLSDKSIGTIIFLYIFIVFTSYLCSNPGKTNPEVK